jgi:Retrotransposon gag protein
MPNESDGDRSRGPTFLRFCQTYVRLCPDSFSDDQTRIIWALSYMKSGRAAKWAARIFKYEEDNEGCTRFLDWEDFKTEFHKEFCPANSDAAAINKLESTAYFQKTRSVDNYLDEFLDLIAESGYTDPKTLVVKFRRELSLNRNSELGRFIN